ncbi:hypothetical protein [Silvibacterium sp.]|uniref:hypothetical protein n=1 Tax=Silvibacterium sp. TaxID=1964179 RepID=UPI0039E36B05
MAERFSGLIEIWQKKIDDLSERIEFNERLAREHNPDHEGVFAAIEVMKSERNIWQTAIDQVKAALVERA